MWLPWTYLCGLSVFPQGFLGPEVLMEPGNCQTWKSCLVKGQDLYREAEGCTHPGTCLLYQHSRRNTEVREENSVEGTGSFDCEVERTPEPKGTEGEASQSICLLASKRMTKRERAPVCQMEL